MTAPAPCRSCGGRTQRVLSPGPIPLVNRLPAAADAPPDRLFPLDLNFCTPCALLQLDQIVPPEVLFADYPYLSSCSHGMSEHVRGLADGLIRSRGLTAASRVIEAGSNDGYLLRHYRDAGIPVLGVDPADQAASAAERNGIPVMREFFGPGLAERLAAAGTRANVFHAHNVLAHCPDPGGFVAGIRRVLAAGGAAVIEVPGAADLVDGCAFDTIYHEHVFYFSLTSLHRLLARHGLRIVSARRTGVHGGSLSVVAEAGGGAPPADVAGALEAERRRGLDGAGAFSTWAGRITRLQAEIRGALSDLKRAGTPLAAYGAAAKGVVLSSLLGVGRETLEFVADRNPLKVGRFMPGSRIPIVGPDALLRERPGCVLLLAWNWADEILAQQEEYRRGGGRFLIPIPSPRIV